VNIDDILNELVATNNTPSSFGAQIERLWSGTTERTDSYIANAALHDNMLSKAPVLRFIGDFTNQVELNPPDRYPALNRYHRSIDGMYNQGAICLYVLRLYQEWATKSKERGLAHIYKWINKHSTRDTVELHSKFAAGEAKKARKAALDLYSDCYLACADYLDQWKEENGYVQVKKAPVLRLLKRKIDTSGSQK
jgi:hypothetical protein